jgi:hypothetical protein
MEKNQIEPDYGSLRDPRSSEAAYIEEHEDFKIMKRV